MISNNTPGKSKKNPDISFQIRVLGTDSEYRVCGKTSGSYLSASATRNQIQYRTSSSCIYFYFDKSDSKYIRVFKKCLPN